MTEDVCQSCGSDRIRTNKIRNGLSYVECKSCGHCSKVTLSGSLQHEFEAAQGKYYGEESILLSAEPSPFEREAFEMRTRIVSRVLPKGSSVIEVGPGAGVFLQWLVANGYRATAIEHSQELAGEIAAKLSIPVIAGDFDNVEIDQEKLDAFCSFHVIEHVSDPAQHLAKAFKITRPGGFAFIATPNARSWQQRIPGKLSPNYDSAHLWIFSRESLRRLCEEAGWTVIDVMTPEYTIGWLRVATKILRRIRGEHEEASAGKYATGSSLGVRRLSGVLRLITSPVRWVQIAANGGNELLFVLRK